MWIARSALDRGSSSHRLLKFVIFNRPPPDETLKAYTADHINGLGLHGKVTTDIGRGVATQTNSHIPKNTGIRQPMVGHPRRIRVQRLGWEQIGV
jgi:hypothetical protein